MKGQGRAHSEELDNFMISFGMTFNMLFKKSAQVTLS